MKLLENYSTKNNSEKTSKNSRSQATRLTIALVTIFELFFFSAHFVSPCKCKFGDLHDRNAFLKETYSGVPEKTFFTQKNSVFFR